MLLRQLLRKPLLIFAALGLVGTYFLLAPGGDAASTNLDSYVQSELTMHSSTVLTKGGASATTGESVHYGKAAWAAFFGGSLSFSNTLTLSAGTCKSGMSVTPAVKANNQGGHDLVITAELPSGYAATTFLIYMTTSPPTGSFTPLTYWKSIEGYNLGAGLAGASTPAEASHYGYAAMATNGEYCNVLSALAKNPAYDASSAPATPPPSNSPPHATPPSDGAPSDHAPAITTVIIPVSVSGEVTTAGSLTPLTATVTWTLKTANGATYTETSARGIDNTGGALTGTAASFGPFMLATVTGVNTITVKTVIEGTAAGGPIRETSTTTYTRTISSNGQTTANYGDLEVAWAGIKAGIPATHTGTLRGAKE